MFPLALAIAPGLAICIYVFYRDVYDKEPAMNLVLAFIWGMLSTLPAVAVEMATDSFRGLSIVSIIITSFLLTALPEEFSKFLPLRYYGFSRRSFDEPLDGIVYGIMVSMGFATIENIVYVYEYGMSIALMRIFTAVPAHAAFGVIMGYYVGKAKFDSIHRNRLLLKAVLIPAVVHGCYDLFLFMTQNEWMQQYISQPVSEFLFFACAVITLITAIIFSLRLVRMHRLTSSRLYKGQPVLTIRYASVPDTELIRTLALQIWPLTYSAILSPRQIRYMMDLMYSEQALKEQMIKGAQFIIVYNAGIPIGFASYSETIPGIYKLHKIYLLARQQGRGSGKFVIEQIIRDIQPKGATALQLNVNRNNKAVGFYERLGFKILREEDIDIGNGFYMNDYVMEKKLSMSTLTAPVFSTTPN